MTFCNLDQFSSNESTAFRDKLASGTLKKSMKTGLDSTIGILSQSTILNMLFMYRAHQNILINKTLIDMLDTPLNETIVSCIYNFEACASRSFSTFYDMYQGKCITFRASSELKTAGSLNGLRLELFLGPQNRESKYTLDRGMLVKIHNESSDPGKNDGILIEPGTNTNIVVSKIINKKLTEPYNKCVKPGDNYDSDLYRLIVDSKSIYQQK